MEQRLYLRDRFITEHPDGFYVIVPRDVTVGIPLCCELCRFAMRTRDDESAWYEFKCCHRCSLVWASPRRTQWAEGWRPSDEQLLNEIEQRTPFLVELEVD